MSFYPKATQERQKLDRWSNQRLRAFEHQGVQNTWGHKEMIALKAQRNDRAALSTVLRFNWVDIFRMDDAQSSFFHKAVRQGTPFRDRHRQYRISRL